MDTATFHLFRDLVYERSGITLREGKEVLVAARVGKRMRQLGLEDHKAYLRHVVEDQSGEELVALLDAISTNVTSFFRESDHFAYLDENLKRWAAAGQTRFRLWSAACSTGEEPYTIAMVLRDALDGRVGDSRILATDLNTAVLAQAAAGEYPAERLQQIPPPLRGRYFSKVAGSSPARIAVAPELRTMVTFRRMNLAEVPYPLKGPLDVVLCRNVMIYFDNTVRERLLREMVRLLRPGGILMVGHAESLTGLAGGLKAVKPSVYIKP